MGYVTAIEASKRIGVGERTIRLWISQGKMKAEKVAVNRLAIDERDVDKIAKERSRYRDSGWERYEGGIYERLSELERQVTELTKQVALLTERLAVMESLNRTEKVKKTSVSYGVAVSSGESLPDSCVFARDFARQHGVNESSFRRHMNAGIGGERVDAEVSSKGRYLTPLQQTGALEFWGRHGVKHV
jgi:Predicted site-specific integrase-resolvase